MKAEVGLVPNIRALASVLQSTVTTNEKLDCEERARAAQKLVRLFPYLLFKKLSYIVVGRG